MVKNKEQVRHFYYRTWHKISKHIDFANGELPIISVTPKTAGTQRDLTETQRVEQYLFLEGWSPTACSIKSIYVFVHVESGLVLTVAAMEKK